MLRRLAITMLALWLPAATGIGGRAAALAVEEVSHLVGVTLGKRHLPCHGEGGAATKDCCCKKDTQIRAAVCGCHDGEAPSAPVVHDPMIAAVVVTRPFRPDTRRMARPDSEAPPRRDADAPDPPPPRGSFSAQA